MESEKFRSWDSTDDKGKKVSYSHYLTFEEIVMLNSLCLTYHSGFGYDLNEHYCETGEIYPLMSIGDDHKDLIKSENIDGDETFIKTSNKYAKKIGETFLLHHKEIIVVLDDINNPDYRVWHKKPKPVLNTWFREDKYEPQPGPLFWYEFPKKPFKGPNNKKSTLLGPLSRRKYIHVDIEFEKIRVNSEEKGSPLTIDDVLFACRGLCADDTRSVENFNVLSDNGSTLVLKANIDNYSS